MRDVEIYTAEGRVYASLALTDADVITEIRRIHVLPADREREWRHVWLYLPGGEIMVTLPLTARLRVEGREASWEAVEGTRHVYDGGDLLSWADLEAERCGASATSASTSS